MKKILSKEVIIGVIVIISLAVLFFGIEYLKGINIFTPANFYYAKYGNVEGLNTSAPVTINGYQIGLVRSIQYDYADNGKMKVELSLDKEVRLPEGTVAVLSKDLLGTAAIQLELGSSTEYVKSGEELEARNAIGMMDKVTVDLMPTIATMLPKLDSIMSNINTLTSNPALNASLSRLDEITANLAQTTAMLNRVAASQLPVTMQEVKSIAANADSITNNLMTLSATLKSLPLDKTVENLNGTTENLNKVTSALTSKNSSLGLLINDRGLYDHLDNTVSNIDSLLIDLRYHPKKYVNFKLF